MTSPNGAAQPAPHPPELDYLATIEVLVAEPLEVGQTRAGRRRVIPIEGGTVTGPRLRGRVLRGGADFQLISSATTSELDARYVLETDDGERLFVTNTAYRTGTAADIEALAAGERVPPERIYFRCVPRFEVAGEKWRWLEHTVVIGSGRRDPDRVIIDLWQVR
ncbi:hypothetical protein CGZ94_09755 [Enemella evansiae]|uniref:UPF0311 protein CGZ94_09755 n=1 Tax=Enemella evansiae TaxID=2016499 RepID=A0A255GJX1_9ACTN|nr:DUF3237 domain-containing protein [Enemella evansiae]OYN94119.1 hypothetical protein CGZ96_19885 [Enemella evansiae]OYO13274.1 hypothetical protein CGZ94_09755 [Enemella evansiae]